jgi:hypothetical protein
VSSGRAADNNYKEVSTVNKKAIERLAEDVTSLRACGFESLAEVAVFFEVAIATMNSKLSGVTEISRAVKLPNSTVSRHLWELNRRGFLDYATDPKDRRVKRIRARLEVFNEPDKEQRLAESASERVAAKAVE